MSDYPEFPQVPSPRNVGNVEVTEEPPAGSPEVVTTILRSETLPVQGRILVVALDETTETFAGLPNASALRHGRIEWRVGRRQQTADFDIKAGGAVFALTCDWAQVFVVRQPDPGSGQKSYAASMSIAFGVPTLLPPTRTVAIVVQQASTSPIASIPHKAVAVRITAPVGNSASVQIIDGAGTQLAAATAVGATNNPSPVLPLPGGSRTLTISNNLGGTVVLSAIFDLAF